MDDDEKAILRYYRHRAASNVKNRVVPDMSSRHTMASVKVEQDDFIKPIYDSRDYHEFHTSTTIRRDILSDLMEFNKYSTFTYENLTAWKVREEITADSNETTPVKMPAPPPANSKTLEDDFTPIGRAS